MEPVIKDIDVEHALLEDLPAVLELWHALMELTSRVNPRYRLAPDAGRRQEAYFYDFFNSTSAAIFITRVDECVVGFANIYTTHPSAVFVQHVLGIVENIYVLPEHRRRGLARKLVARCHDFFRQHRVDEIYVNVVPKNELSETFWSAMGYETQKLTMSFREL